MTPVTLRRWIGLAGRIAREAQARDVPVFAAAVAYYAFVSLVPLLALALVAATAVGGDALAAVVADLAGRYLLPTGREAVVAALRGTWGRGSATVLGVAALAWSSLRLFRGVDAAFSRVYGSGREGFLDQVRDGLIALASVGVGTLSVVLVVGALGVLLRRSTLAGLTVPLSVVVLAAAFFPLYYVFPDVDVTPREVLPGTAIAAGGWALLGTAFGAYAAYAASAGRIAVYGVLGGLVLLVTWFYLAGLLLLVGAVTNAVLAGRLGPDRQVQHPRGRHDATMGADGPDDADRDADATTGGDATGEDGPAADAGSGPPGDDGGTGRSRAAGEGGAGPAGGDAGAREAAGEVAELEERVADLRDDLDAFRQDVDRRTLHRDEVRAELKRYVRRRIRRGHARGWGPYLVLLYGTVMTLGAFYFLEGVWAILAMIVLFLSTLGLFVLFVLVGLGLSLLGTPRKAYERVREFRK